VELHSSETRKSDGPLVVGVDFDNTIVSYDAVFHRVCRERNWIPEEIPINKTEVRNYLRRVGREDDWTEMQGHVYGKRMADAAAFPGLIEFLRSCLAREVEIHIISHKTRRPFRGEQYDLHLSALGWLESNGIFDPRVVGLPRQNVHFELTKEAKISRIGSCHCAVFIDDLPEFLAEPSFPEGTRRVLFDPNNLYADHSDFSRLTSWTDVEALGLW
jgi:hypothetical protein